MNKSFDINELRSLYSNLSSDELTYAVNYKSSKPADACHLSPDINNSLDLVCPVDPVLNVRHSDLHTLLTDNVDDSIKSIILDNLKQLPQVQNSSFKLSDDELLNLVPSRYAQCPNEVQAYSQFVLDHLDTAEPVTPNVDLNSDIHA